jgi:SpoVK/Ycf46/Vps4 family AAA+-type ATPase
MRAIARQSARLANGVRVRHTSRGRQLNAALTGREFHQGPSRLSQDPGSNNRPNQSSPTSTVRPSEEQHKRGIAIPTEDQEVEGSDVKESDEVRKPLARKTLRQRRNAVDAIPAPPPVPDWFLRYNVKLKIESVQRADSTEKIRVLRCVDGETGHTLFTLPSSFNSSVLASRVASKPLSVNRDRDATKQSAGRMPQKSPTEGNFFNFRYNTIRSAAKPQKDDLGDVDKDSATEFDTTDEPALTKPPAVTPGAEPAGQKPDVGPVSKEEARETEKTSDELCNVLRWILLEAEIGVRAGMTAAADSHRSSSFAASRVDLSLICPDAKSHASMDEVVESLAALADADLIRLDVNDLAELTSDFVGRDSDLPGSFSSLGYEVYEGFAAIPARSEASAEEDGAEEAQEIDEEEDDDPDGQAPSGLGFGNLDGIRRALFERRHELHRALSSINVAGIVVEDFRPSASSSNSSRISSPDGDTGVSWDDARLVAVLDGLLDAPERKRDALPITGAEASHAQLRGHSSDHSLDKTNHGINASDEAFRTPNIWRTDVARLLSDELVKSKLQRSYTFEESDSTPEGLRRASVQEKPAKIIHLRDLADISKTSLGNTMIRRIVRLARKRRQAGENILVVGTSAISAPRTEFLDMLRWLGDAKQRINLPFRHLVVPPISSLAPIAKKFQDTPSTGQSMYGRIVEINLRHMESMLRRLRPMETIELSGEKAFEQMGEAQLKLGATVLSQDSIQRVVLAAIGMAKSHARSDNISPVHIGLALQVCDTVDKIIQAWAATAGISRTSSEEALTGSTATSSEKEKVRMERLKKQCNAHEAKLLAGVVDPQNIKVGFEQVHAPTETIESLKTLTSLSLTRPDAFQYGILAQDRLTGLMLYGPPGTGKTLLAKAVAKECKAAVLEVSGAQIYDKYVGEGEKMVKAVFSLAKKLSPCIVFIDEADAIFGSRSNAGNRNTHREIINQFLREWDGMDLHNVFIMVATNRPFDVDDAVLRRLPRRLLVDLPVAKDRESILKIHLRDEQLDPAVSVGEMAEKTAFYSGSDLKNLCVAAALACVREESELAASKSNDPEFKLPEKRTLAPRHFDKAIKEISASISEDMSSLTAIRKFDEQYGDGRGKKKKAGYGFGLGDAGVDEMSVRVRQPPPP